MYKTVQIKGRKYKINVEQFAEFLGGVFFVTMILAAFLFFFGCCWGGFLR